MLHSSNKQTLSRAVCSALHATRDLHFIRIDHVLLEKSARTRTPTGHFFLTENLYDDLIILDRLTVGHKEFTKNGFVGQIVGAGNTPKRRASSLLHHTSAPAIVRLRLISV